MQPKRACLLLLIFTTLSMLSTNTKSTSLCSSCVYSSLWGVTGEKWDPRNRLPDFSYAGYHAGEVRLPKPPATWDLKHDFHAVGDGHADDSSALISALQSI